MSAVSCAGPFTPFGGINDLSPKAGAPELPPDGAGQASISFFPPTQSWHAASELVVRAQGQFPTAPELRVFYNGREITNSLEDRWVQRPMSDGTEFRLKDTFILPMETDHRLSFSFRPGPASPWTTAELPAPGCLVSQSVPLRSMEEFKDKWQLLNRLEKIAQERSINPSFYAGLLAALSGLDSRVVGSSKELGPAQLGPAAATLVEIGRPHWQRSKAVENVNPLTLKFLVSMGKVNGEQDWRLDEEKSLIGGADYLTKIRKFWEETDNMSIFTQAFGPLENAGQEYSDLVAASYVAGSSKVLDAVRTLGRNWGRASNLKTARRAVARARSYCKHFSVEAQQ